MWRAGRGNSEEIDPSPMHLLEVSSLPDDNYFKTPFFFFN